MALQASKVQVGDTYTQELTDDLSRTQIVQYAGASGDYNPLHSDEIFTTKVAKYPTVFAHGMLTMGHDRPDGDRLRRRRPADGLRRSASRARCGRATR